MARGRSDFDAARTSVQLTGIFVGPSAPVVSGTGVAQVADVKKKQSLRETPRVDGIDVKFGVMIWGRILRGLRPESLLVWDSNSGPARAGSET